MSAYVMPDIRVATNVVKHNSNTAISRSPLSGAVQRKVRDGEHLGIQVSLQNLTAEPRRLMMSWVSLLNGAENQAVIRDRSYEKPSGTLSSITEIVDVTFNATLWEVSTAGGDRGSISDISDGVRFLSGTNFGSVVLRPQTGTDGISAPTAGYSYVARISVSDARPGIGGATETASVRWLDANWGNEIANSAQTDDTSSEYLSVAATCTSITQFYLRPLAKYGSASDTAGMTQDFSGLSASRCLLVDNGFNALTYSEQFDNAAWPKTNSTVTANATTSPDGLTAGDELVEDSTASATHAITQAYTRSSALEFWTASVWIKQNSSQRIRLNIDDGAANGGFAFFDSNTGTITSGPTDQGTGTLTFASIDAYPNSWYRCRVTTMLPATTTARVLIYLCDGANNTVTFNGDGTSSIYLWGAQLQRGGQLGRYTETIATSNTGTSQIGRQVWLKGLNHAEDQQMLAGDQFEINGQLFILSADLDGDESGCGIARVTTSIRTAPSDEDPAILYKPHGTFLLQNPSNGWSNQPGGFSNTSLSFVEDIAV